MFDIRFIWKTLLVLAAFNTSALAVEENASELAVALKQFKQEADDFEQRTSNLNLPFAGTAFNETGVSSFKCAALALGFRKTAIFERLSVVELPELAKTPTDGDLQALSVTSIELNNRILSTEAVMDLPDRDRREVWNLDCVGNFGIGKDQFMPRIAPKAAFEMHGDQLQVLGDIDFGFFERFKTFLLAHPETKSVALGSGGGSVKDAIQSGLLIRSLRIETTLSANCYSACPLIFLGGVERTVWSPYPKLGFHQVSEGGNAIPFDSEIYRLIGNYAESMGAKKTSLMTFMHAAEPESMNYPDVWDLCKHGITTWVQRGC